MVNHATIEATKDREAEREAPKAAGAVRADVPTPRGRVNRNVTKVDRMIAARAASVTIKAAKADADCIRVPAAAVGAGLTANASAR